MSDGDDSSETKKRAALEGSRKIALTVKKFTLALARTALPLYAALLGSQYTEKPDGKFEEKDRARVEMLENGITSEQASVYKMGLSELLNEGITPVGYDVTLAGHDHVKDFIPNLAYGRFSYEKMKNGFIESLPEREDAWKLYLGLRQEHDTFGISDYHPGHSAQDKFYYKLNGFMASLRASFAAAARVEDAESRGYFEDVMEQKCKGDEASDLRYMQDHPHEKLRNSGGEEYGWELGLVLPRVKDWFERGKGDKSRSFEKNLLQLAKTIQENGGKMILRDMITTEDGKDRLGVMGSYTVALGHDEKGNYLSYYDKWDLAAAIENSRARIGRPFEIYDRFYYDPATGKIDEALLSK